MFIKQLYCATSISTKISECKNLCSMTDDVSENVSDEGVGVDDNSPLSTTDTSGATVEGVASQGFRNEDQCNSMQSTAIVSYNVPILCNLNCRAPDPIQDHSSLSPYQLSPFS